MPTSAATPLSNEVFQENWSDLLNSQTKEPAKISYLMVEKVTPPSYMWDRIAEQLDAEANTAIVPSSSSFSNAGIISILLVGAIAFIAASLYMVL